MTAERQSNEKLQTIRCDNVGEYKALAKTLVRNDGVAVEFTTSYTPEPNGVAERLNRTLTIKIGAMLTEAGLPQWLWGRRHTQPATFIVGRRATTLAITSRHLRRCGPGGDRISVILGSSAAWCMYSSPRSNDIINSIQRRFVGSSWATRLLLAGTVSRIQRTA